MWAWLTEPLQYGFIRYAITVGMMVGILCSVVGSYLVVQRLSLLGDVISHAVLPGLVIANFWGFDLLLGAFLAGLLSTAVMTWIQSQSQVNADSAMALTLVGFFALGVTLITVLESQLDLRDLLFGDILGVVTADLWQTGAIALVILVLVKLFYKELLFLTFDPQAMQALGLPVHLLNLGLVSAITLTIILGMRAVGVVLVIALLIGPPLTAYLLVKELHQVMIFGGILGAIASISGIYLSYYLDWPSGPAIVLVVFTLFLGALLLNMSQAVFIDHGTSGGRR